MCVFMGCSSTHIVRQKVQHNLIEGQLYNYCKRCSTWRGARFTLSTRQCLQILYPLTPPPPTLPLLDQHTLQSQQQQQHVATTTTEQHFRIKTQSSIHRTCGSISHDHHDPLSPHRRLTLKVCVPSSSSVCSTIMSKFSEGCRPDAGFWRATLAPRSILMSSSSTLALGDWSLANREAFTSTVDGR